MADYPSMVVVLAAAYFITRSLAPGRITEAALAGILVGTAGGLKPPNLLLGFGAALAYPIARRWREAVVFGATLAVGLLTLSFWKTERSARFLFSATSRFASPWAQRPRRSA